MYDRMSRNMNQHDNIIKRVLYPPPPVYAGTPQTLSERYAPPADAIAPQTLREHYNLQTGI